MPDDITRLLADSQPFAGDLSLYCTICGAIQGAGDDHRGSCAWRMARRSLGLDTGWPEPTDEPTEADPTWRLLRLKATGAYDPPDDPSSYDPDEYGRLDRSGVFYEDEDRPEGCVPLYRIVGERALVGGRSAAPTRCRLYQVLRDAYYAEPQVAVSQEARTRINRMVDSLAGLLSRSAAEPPEDPATIAAAAAVKATAGHVYAAGYEQGIADADERMPTICLSCMQPIPFAEYVQHRSGCQDDIAESNARLSLCGCGHTAEAHTADGGACTTWRPAHERWCGCRSFVARGVAAEPNEETESDGE